jgi:hypothetical protein
MSREFTPSSNMLKLMSGILQIPIVVSQKQLIRYVMPKITTIVCKLGQEVKSSIIGEWSNHISGINEYSSWKMRRPNL